MFHLSNVWSQNGLLVGTKETNRTRYNKSFGRSHRRCSAKRDVVNNFANFTRKNLYWSLLLIRCKYQACNFFKKRLQHKCFPVKSAKLLRTFNLSNSNERLLLYILWLSTYLCNNIQHTKFYFYKKSVIESAWESSLLTNLKISTADDCIFLVQGQNKQKYQCFHCISYCNIVIPTWFRVSCNTIIYRRGNVPFDLPQSSLRLCIY